MLFFENPNWDCLLIFIGPYKTYVYDVYLEFFPLWKIYTFFQQKLHFSSWFLEQIWQHKTTVIITTILTEFHWQSMGIFYSPDNHNSHQHTQCNHHCLGMLQRIHIYRPLVNNFQNGILRDNHMLWEMKNRNRLNY